MREKTPKESEVIMREMVMPGDTNAHGTIFGGKVLSWIDIAGAMCASLHSNTQVVTVHMDDIEFKSPINIGCQWMPHRADAGTNAVLLLVLLGLGFSTFGRRRSRHR